jgi:hypothetical protein
MCCQMQCFGAECGHVAFCLTLLDVTLKKKRRKFLWGGAFKMGRFLYTVVYCTYTAIRFVYGKYTVYGSAVYALPPSLVLINKMSVESTQTQELS